MKKSNEQASLQEIQQKIENVKAEGYFSAYSNNVAFSTNAFDFSLVFGEMTDITPGKLRIEQKVRIVMTPIHARLLLQVLQQQVDSYESQFGPINVPASLQVISVDRINL
jgi:hypothetical protein